MMQVLGCAFEIPNSTMSIRIAIGEASISPEVIIYTISNQSYGSKYAGVLSLFDSCVRGFVDSSKCQF